MAAMMTARARRLPTTDTAMTQSSTPPSGISVEVELSVVHESVDVHGVDVVAVDVHEVVDVHEGEVIGVVIVVRFSEDVFKIF